MKKLGLDEAWKMGYKFFLAYFEEGESPKKLAVQKEKGIMRIHELNQFPFVCQENMIFFLDSNDCQIEDTVSRALVECKNTLLGIEEADHRSFGERDNHDHRRKARS